MAMPPSLTKSWALRSRALPTPTMTRRDRSSPGGATRSSAEPFLPLNRSAAAARPTRSPVGPSARRAAEPNLTPSSQNRTRTPLAGAATGANSSFRRPDMRPLLWIRRKLEAAFADAIKRAPIARLICEYAHKDVKWGVFAPPCTADRGRDGSVEGRRRRRGGAPESTSSQVGPVRARKGLLRRRLWPLRHTIQINVLLCILKGFALAKPLCCRIK